MSIINKLGSWKFWIIVIIVVFFILWVFLGNKENRKIVPTYPTDFLPPQQFCVDRSNKPHFSPKNENKIPDVRKGRSISENMAVTAFTELIQLYGGNINDVKYNIRLPEILNPETNRRLELDCYYDNGIKKIGLEYQGAQHYNFPNHYHNDTEKGRSDFESQLRRDKYKLKACEDNNICLIRVPYTVDTCDCDENEPSGYKYNSKITKKDKKLRLLKFIKERLDYCLNV